MSAVPSAGILPDARVGSGDCPSREAGRVAFAGRHLMLIPLVEMIPSALLERLFLTSRLLLLESLPIFRLRRVLVSLLEVVGIGLCKGLKRTSIKRCALG